MITLRVSDEQPIGIKYIEGKVKPEVVAEVTPTPNSQTIYPQTGTVFGQINVHPIPSEYIIPTGTKDISTNGVHNVAAYEQVNVDVHEVPTKGVVFGDFNANGCPTSVTTYGFTSIPAWYFYNVGNNQYNRPLVMGYVNNIHLNEGIIYIEGDSSFRGMSKVNELRIPSTGERIGSAYMFASTPLTLLDMSMLNSVPTLVTAQNNIGLPSGVTIRVKQALLTEWQNTTNWNALTGVIWEGV